jgi:DNA mismatch repair protein MutS
MPPELLQRADEILALLEEKHGGDGKEEDTATRIRKKQPAAATFQLNIFDGLTEDLRRIRQLLDETDINTLTPVEALMKLNEMKAIVKPYK